MDSMNGLANNCQVNNSNGSRNMNQNNSTNNGNGGSGGGHMNSNNDIRHTYTIPGIVQFLQYEWQRFELRRQQWEVCAGVVVASSKFVFCFLRTPF